MVGRAQIVLGAIGFDVAAGEEPFAFPRRTEFTGGHGTNADSVFNVESRQIRRARLIRQWKVLAL